MNVNTSTPEWNGIIPGQSTPDDVVAIMGEPDSVIKCEIRSKSWNIPKFLNDIAICLSDSFSYEYQQVRSSNLPPAKHEIRFRNRKVWTVVEDTRIFQKEITLDTLVRLYGPPEKVVWSGLSPYYRAVLFCQHGVLAQASQEGIKFIYYFKPLALDKCIQSFYNDISRKNPFPDSDVIGPEDPWNIGPNP